MDIYPYAPTSPVYVGVGGARVRSPEDARFFLAWIDRLEKAARDHRGWNNAAEKEAVLTDIARARTVYRDQVTPCRRPRTAAARARPLRTCRRSGRNAPGPRRPAPGPRTRRRSRHPPARTSGR